jgi:hypothetical protein
MHGNEEFLVSCFRRNLAASNLIRAAQRCDRSLILDSTDVRCCANASRIRFRLCALSAAGGTFAGFCP